MTEKNYNPKQKETKAMKKQEKVAEAPKQEIIEKKKETKKKEEIKEKKITKPKIKKTEAVVNLVNLPVSTKVSMAIGRFIRGKTIEKAIEDLEQVTLMKKAVPMKGEIPHRKGKIMSGRFPIKAAQQFIRILKGLLANANVNEIENPIISESIANIGARPFGKFGRIRRKRTHITIKAKSKKSKEKK